MNRRKLIAATLALVLCGALAVAFWPENPEPAYRGRKLSWWVLDVKSSSYLSAEAREAVRATGTNGLPFYMEWIVDQPGWWTRVMYAAANRSDKWLHTQWHPEGRRFLLKLFAVQALRELGENAAPAIPQLVAASLKAAQDDDGSRFDAAQAMSILVNMDPSGVPAILSLMTNEHARVRTSAILTARTAKDPSIVAQIKKSLNDPDPEVRRMAASVLSDTNSADAYDVEKQ
jgi:hypothetical protein